MYIPFSQSTAGFSKYVPEKCGLLWNIKTFPVSLPIPLLGICYIVVVCVCVCVCVRVCVCVCRGGGSMCFEPTLGCQLWRQRRERAGHLSRSSLRSLTSPPQGYRYSPQHPVLCSSSFCAVCVAGSLPEDYREEWLPGPALGEIHHSEWRYGLTHTHLTSCLTPSPFPSQITSCAPHELTLAPLASRTIV